MTDAGLRCDGDGMGDHNELTLRLQAGAKPLDAETATRIGRAARADAVELSAGGAIYGFSLPAADSAIARGNVEMGACFTPGARWHTRYELWLVVSAPALASRESGSRSPPATSRPQPASRNRTRA